MTVALVIDDNRQTAEALIQMLSIWDITGRLALGPTAALSILGKEAPKVVFLDINMPGVNGFEVLAYLRRDPRFMHVPVIIVTSDDQPETAKKALREGASSVVLKPVMMDILETALKKIGILN